MSLTREQFLERIRNSTNELLKKQDSNGNKKLSKLEVASALTKDKVPNPILATNSLFALYDKNNDNELSADEIDALVLVKYIEAAEKYIKDFIDHYFKANANMDNKISKAEAIKFFSNSKDHNKKNAEAYANSMFEDVDSNKDKSITRDELREYCIKHYNIYPAE